MKQMKIAHSMLDLIGEIPLVRLNRIGKEIGSEILVKPEFLNPSGSIKDRIAKLMVEEAEKNGIISKDSTILEATTGNTGTSLAFVAAVKGYKFVAYSPKLVANKSRSSIMLAFGCSMEAVDINIFDQRFGDKQPPNDDGSAHGGRVELLPRRICKELENEDKNLWWARQFSNPDNVRAHREGTAREIIEKTDGNLDAFVTSIGTGGTLLGVAHELKAYNPKIRIIAVEPSGKEMLKNPEEYPIIPGITDGIILDIFKSSLLDEVISITDEEAINMAHQLAEKEGMFCGMSSGANVCASIQIAGRLGKGTRVVTVLPDSRDRYLEIEKYTT